MPYKTTVGLEVHVELNTKSKIFCGCKVAFAGEPNTHVCPVCSGMPGTLPVLNEQVVELAIRTGLALNCAITPTNRFDRKNYFYPDLPKAYQISQLYFPVCTNGWLEIASGERSKKIRIHEIHMEEDAGKLVHDPWEDCTLVDYNRCGVPLLEIVSEPDFENADEVISYLERLREILMFLDVSDCKMQEGSLRADINLSVRREGEENLGVRTEMKNMNSLKAIHRAIRAESKRQIEVLESGGRVIQETRRWDDNKDASFSMRTKEDAQDYRYFPDPDLQPVYIDNPWITRIRDGMKELPEHKRRRYVEEFKLPPYDAKILTTAKELAALFEETVALCEKPKEAANLIMTQVMRLMSESNTLPENLQIEPRKLAEIIKLISEGKINRTVGTQVLEKVFESDVEPADYVEAHGLVMVEDTDLLTSTVTAVLKENEQSVLDYRGGKEKAFGFLVGQTMKKLKGKANPQSVNRLLKEMLK